MTLWDWFSLLSGSLFSAVIIVFFFSSLLPRRFKHKAIYAIPIAVYTLLSAMAHCVTGTQLVFIVNFLLILFTLLFFSSLKEGLFYAALLEVVFLLSDGVVYYTISILFRLDPQSAMTVAFFDMLGNLCTNIFVCLIAYSYARKLKVYQSSDLPRGYWLIFLTFPLGSTYILFKVYTFYLNGSIEVTDAMMLVLILYSINILTLFLYTRMVDFFIIKIGNHALMTQIEAFTQKQQSFSVAYRKLSAIRHNLKNSLIPLQTLIDMGEYEKSKTILKMIIGDIDRSTYNIFTGVPLLDDIINYKSLEAEQRGSHIIVDTNLKKALDIPSLDLSIIAGIALDNAIEASDATTEPKQINVVVYSIENALIFQVANKKAHQIRVSNGAILSTKSDSADHGLGLKTIQALVEKNKGEFDIKYDNTTFILKVVLFGK